MKNILKKWLWSGIGAGMFMFAIAQPCFASVTGLDRRITRAKTYLDDINMAPDRGIPATLLSDCKGIIFMRVYNAGFVFGIKGGYGIVLVKNQRTKEWSAPAFLNYAGASFGAQIGLQEIDAIFLIMNQKGIDMLMKTKFTIGVDASAAAGPLGRDFAGSIGPGTAILVYSRAKGLYAGATFAGAAFVNDNADNHEFYNNNEITTRDILFRGAVPVPQAAIPLINDIEKYSKEYSTSK
ncbi:MAG: lipid-binding SYLF domain-containing protein [Candidatus Omnitrophica bacterium]|nr:lipid-binding SYLF domain-containing protein [Candidatus Omnitrophota bacterium]